MSNKVRNIYDECAVNAVEATPRRCSILGVLWGICGESAGQHPCGGLISIKMDSSSFVGIMIRR